MVASADHSASPHLVLLLLHHDLGIAGLLAHSAEVKPGLELLKALEDVWQQEVEQTPQLAQVVLQGRACNMGLGS